MVHGCGDLSGFTSDKLSSQSNIRHLAFIRLFARGQYRSKYITGANRFTIIHVVARWHHHLYLCQFMKLEVNNINNAVLFTMLIDVMLVHGYMPNDMLAPVLVSIPKDPLISDRYSNQLMTSNAQFAFKKCHSTSMCTALVKEVVGLSYCNGRNTNVYACLLDATKAFDCVRYDKLFELLLKKDIPGTVIRLLPT